MNHLTLFAFILVLVFNLINASFLDLSFEILSPEQIDEGIYAERSDLGARYHLVNGKRECEPSVRALPQSLPQPGTLEYLDLGIFEKLESIYKIQGMGFDRVAVMVNHIPDLVTPHPCIKLSAISILADFDFNFNYCFGSFTEKTYSLKSNQQIRDYFTETFKLILEGKASIKLSCMELALFDESTRSHVFNAFLAQAMHERQQLGGDCDLVEFSTSFDANPYENNPQLKVFDYLQFEILESIITFSTKHYALQNFCKFIPKLVKLFPNLLLKYKSNRSVAGVLLNVKNIKELSDIAFINQLDIPHCIEYYRDVKLDSTEFSSDLLPLYTLFSKERQLQIRTYIIAQLTSLSISSDKEYLKLYHLNIFSVISQDIFKADKEFACQLIESVFNDNNLNDNVNPPDLHLIALIFKTIHQDSDLFKNFAESLLSESYFKFAVNNCLDKWDGEICFFAVLFPLSFMSTDVGSTFLNEFDEIIKKRRLEFGAEYRGNNVTKYCKREVSDVEDPLSVFDIKILQLLANIPVLDKAFQDRVYAKLVCHVSDLFAIKPVPSQLSNPLKASSPLTILHSLFLGDIFFGDSISIIAKIDDPAYLSLFQSFNFEFTKSIDRFALPDLDLSGETADDSLLSMRLNAFVFVGLLKLSDFLQIF